jgi:hypothetical protein
MLFYNNQLEQLYMAVKINGTPYFVYTPYVPDNNWHQLVGTYNSGNLSIFLDGTFRNSARARVPSDDIDSNQGPVVIGSLADYFNYPYQTRWEGSIGKISIYNRTLSKQEVEIQYQDEAKKVAYLGSIEIPFRVSFNLSLKINASVSVRDISQNSTTLGITILKDKETIFSSNLVTITDSRKFDGFQNICLGTVGPLQPNVEYKLKIYNPTNNSILVSQVTAQISW